MVWYYHLCKNFPQFVVIHKLKGFSIVKGFPYVVKFKSEFFKICWDPHKGFCVVKETAVGVFLEFPCFLYNPIDVGNLISGSSTLIKLYYVKALSDQASSLAPD